MKRIKTGDITPEKPMNSDSNENATLVKAKAIIFNNLNEFQSMYTGRDPRLPNYEWITEDEVMQIHKEIIKKVGGADGIHNKVDLNYAIEHPKTNNVGIDKGLYHRICECAYLLARCFVDCGAQVSATVFLTLCERNHFITSFKLGDIFDIFPQIVGPTMAFDIFYEEMKSHIVPTRKNVHRDFNKPRF